MFSPALARSLLANLISSHLILFFYSLSIDAAAIPATNATTFTNTFALPWSAPDTNVLDANGNNITLTGINWSGSLELMIPEGLQYASVESILARFKSVGINAVRHTFAIEMIDELVERGKDISILEAAIKALGKENGTKIAQSIVANNKQYGWTLDTTRLQVLDTIARLEHRVGILMHLDNHISSAKWCCSPTDDNAFFGDTSFDVDKWRRGLSYMARWAAGHGNIASIALRNELRKPKTANPNISYNWESWVKYMTAGAEAVHAANSDLLILFSGLDSDTTLADVVYGKTSLDLDNVPYSNKIVFELHRYEVQKCESTFYSLYYSGFSATGLPQPKACQNKCPESKNRAPVWLTEIGGNFQDGSVAKALECMRDFTLTAYPQKPITWFLWTSQGSYYINKGVADADEAWGLFNHDWSGFRNASLVENFYKPWTAKTMPTSFISKARTS